MFDLYSNFGKQLKAKLIELGFSLQSNFVGCQAVEIEAAKNSQFVSFLPQIYIEFLAEMGREAHQLFIGSSYNCDSILFLKEELEEIVKSPEHSFQVPKDIVVFLGHQGYVFYYFHTIDHNENPPVYMYYEKDETSRKLNETLTQFFEDRINEMKTGSYKSRSTR